MKSLAEFVQSTPFFLIAHRGISALAPENTLSAITLAIESGVAMVEIDVQQTIDKELIVFHDNVLGRTSNGHGYVSNTPLNHIRTLDAGSWFAESYCNEQIPLLSEALDVIQGRAYLNIEIKPRSEAIDAEHIASAVLSIIEDRQLLPFTVLSSFDHHLLRLLKMQNRHVHTCALHVPQDLRLPHEVVSDCNASAYGCSLDELNTRVASSCRDYGIPFGVYTVNNKQELDAAKMYGVNAVVTNHPAAL